MSHEQLMGRAEKPMLAQYLTHRWGTVDYVLPCSGVNFPKQELHLVTSGGGFTGSHRSLDR
jgi:hypothetical protein